MIFSRFFSPSVKSADAKTRIAAIERLSADKPHERNILRELAFNDADVQVAKAALHKIGSFALWQKASQTIQESQLRDYAARQVELILLGQHQVVIAEKEKRAFLTESAAPDLLIRLLETDASLRADEDLVKQLLNRIDKPAFTQQYVMTYASLPWQQAFIEQSTDAAWLQRLQRRAKNAAVVEQVNARLATLEEAQQRPLVIEKDARLVLAKLQALLDRYDYEDVHERLHEITNAWQGIEMVSSTLSNELWQVLADKHADISARVASHYQRLRQAYEKQHAEQQSNERMKDATARMRKISHDISAALSGDIMTFSTELATELSIRIDTLDAFLAENNIKVFANEIAACRQQLLAIPSIQQRLATLMNWLETARHRVEQEASNIDTLKEALFSEWRQLSSTDAKQHPIVRQKWREIRERVEHQQKQQRAAASAQLRDVRATIGKIERLIENGKYRIAMKRYTQLQPLLSDLTHSALGAVEKHVEGLSQRIERLKDWQDYIATPRRPELVEEAMQLAENVSLTVVERAERVKILRSNWLSLGALNDDEEQQYGVAFEKWMEAAFAPCRAFYEQQAMLRQQTIDKRTELIRQMSEVSVSEPLTSLMATTSALKQQWRSAGHLDRRDYLPLQQQWEEQLTPRQRFIDEQLKANAEKKEALITALEQMVEDTDVNPRDATEIKRRFQQVGPAGKRADASLSKRMIAAHDNVQARAKRAEQRMREDSRAQKQALSHQRVCFIDVIRQYPEQLSELASCMSSEQWQTLGPVYQVRAKRVSATSKERQWLTIAMEVIVGIEGDDSEQSLRQTVQLSMMTARLEKGEDWTVEGLLSEWLGAGSLTDKQIGLLERLALILELEDQRR